MPQIVSDTERRQPDLRKRGANGVPPISIPTDDPEAALRAYERKRIGRANGVNKLAWKLSSLSRWSNPAACALRDNMLTVLFALVAKRVQRKDMAYEFE